MARTTSALVQELLTKYNYHKGVNLSPYIEMAASVVDDVISCAASRSPAVIIGSVKAELLERVLAGHFYLVLDLPYKEKVTGKASAKFQGETKMGLQATLLGQQALVLDSTGCLRALDATIQRASLFWLGKAIPERIDYDDWN